ncbi:MAG: hypothetical protein R3338_12910, partial [Thermoanaerobaculia bacterium]|nr:hypothetical protein [Thermoanaerobaculia bacterium]
MSDLTSPEEGGFGEPDRRLTSAILESRLVRTALALLAASAAIYAVPVVPVEYRVLLTTNIAPVVFLALTVLACWRGFRIPESSEAMFWQATALAFTFWLVIRSIFPYVTHQYPIATSIGADVVYALFYLTLILAIEIRPHRRDSWPFASVEQA